jgi:hypothetical protein
MKKLYLLLVFFAFLACETEEPEPQIIKEVETVYVEVLKRDTVVITEKIYLEADTVLLTDTVVITITEPGL